MTRTEALYYLATEARDTKDLALGIDANGRSAKTVHARADKLRGCYEVLHEALAEIANLKAARAPKGGAK
jgi:hypothetical protein